MRPSLRKIVLQNSQRIPQNCIRCETPQLTSLRRPHQPLPSLQQRFYSDSKDPTSKDDSDAGVESTGTVPEDPDIITTESPSIQEPPESAVPPTSAPQTTRPQKVWTSAREKEPWHFRLAERKMGPNARAREVRRLMTTTSLRKSVHWFSPLEGVNPAYDMALMYLKHDRRQKMAAIQRLEERIAKERKGTPPSSSSLWWPPLLKNRPILIYFRRRECRVYLSTRKRTLQALGPPGH
jgi:hypothetical protein